VGSKYPGYKSSELDKFKVQVGVFKGSKGQGSSGFNQVDCLGQGKELQDKYKGLNSKLGRLRINCAWLRINCAWLYKWVSQVE
jgi:hypothetical protein